MRPTFFILGVMIGLTGCAKSFAQTAPQNSDNTILWVIEGGTTSDESPWIEPTANLTRSTFRHLGVPETNMVVSKAATQSSFQKD